MTQTILLSALVGCASSISPPAPVPAQPAAPPLPCEVAGRWSGALSVLDSDEPFADLETRDDVTVHFDQGSRPRVETEDEGWQVTGTIKPLFRLRERHPIDDRLAAESGARVHVRWHGRSLRARVRSVPRALAPLSPGDFPVACDDLAPDGGWRSLISEDQVLVRRSARLRLFWDRTGAPFATLPPEEDASVAYALRRREGTWVEVERRELGGLSVLAWAHAEDFDAEPVPRIFGRGAGSGVSQVCGTRQSLCDAAESIALYVAGRNSGAPARVGTIRDGATFARGGPVTGRPEWVQLHQPHGRRLLNLRPEFIWVARPSEVRCASDRDGANDP